MHISVPYPEKNPTLITPDMKIREDCPCPETAELTYECIYRGYCELCRAYHTHFNFTYCSLPPGKDQYLVPWIEGAAVSTTYKAIEPPSKDIEKKTDCPCKIHCVYNGYCDLCTRHSEEYHACSPSCYI